MAVWVEDNRHDIPWGGEPWRAHVATKRPEEVPFVLWDAVVDLDVVVCAAVVVLQLKVVEGEEDGRTLGHHDEPGTVDVVGVQAREVWAGDVAGWCGQDPSTFETLRLQHVSCLSVFFHQCGKISDAVEQARIEQRRSNSLVQCSTGETKCLYQIRALLGLSIKKKCNSPLFESALSTSSSKYTSMAAQRLMPLLWIRLLSRLDCKTDSGSFRTNSLETSELLPAEVIALWKIHPQSRKRYPTPAQPGLWSSWLNFNDCYPMSASCLLGHSLERHNTFLTMFFLQWRHIYTLSTTQEESATPLSDQIYITTVVKGNYWCQKVGEACRFHLGTAEVWRKDDE